MVLDDSLLNTFHYKVQNKSKWSNSRKSSWVLSNTSEKVPPGHPWLGSANLYIYKGGVAGMSGCLEHTGVLTQLLREAKESKGGLTVLWLDLANAYGSMPHKLVEEALKRHHVPLSVCDLIADYYKNFWLRAYSSTVTPEWQYHYRVYYVCRPILIDYEHACKGGRAGIPRPFV